MQNITSKNPGKPFVRPEGTTSYTYNANKQLTGMSSPGNISRTYTYDSKGRVSTASENINGTNFSTSFTYDSKGRLNTITHPSGIVETNTYNNNGYLASISAGGATRWTNTSMNEKRQLTGGTYGSNLNISYGFDSYGYPESTVTGSVQNYQYNFNTNTGNLNWRKNVLQSNIQENFVYDNLDRLDSAYIGSTAILRMGYGNKGNITSKSDAGSFLYSSATRPYAITGIDDDSGLIPTAEQNIGYYSFEKVDTITEGTYTAKFIYDSDNERARMEIKENGNTILTRWYPTDSYMKETAGGATKEYTYIGGNAYSAPVIAITQSGETNFYYLLRDYLGNITHQVDTTNTVISEWSYDAWGRLRDTSTWEPYDPGSQPTLLAGRGYTGHEHLPWFNLINMNGRVYDPLTGMFLSPDNYIQMPDFTQNFNRYGYCLNNPLIYTDPDGEFIFTYFLNGIGAMIDAACWSALIDYGTQKIKIATGMQEEFNLSELGGAAIGGAAFCGMGLISPSFSVNSTSFMSNSPTYLGQAGWAAFSTAFSTGAGMFASDLFDNGQINYSRKNYFNSMSITGLSSGALSFGASMYRYLTWDRLSIQDRLKIVQDKFGGSEIVHYNDELLGQGIYDPDNSYIELGPSAFSGSKTWAYSSSKHELKHLRDRDKNYYYRYFEGNFNRISPTLHEDKFMRYKFWGEHRAHKLEMYYYRTSLTEYMNILSEIKTKYNFNGFRIVFSHPFLYFNEIF